MLRPCSLSKFNLVFILILSGNKYLKLVKSDKVSEDSRSKTDCLIHPVIHRKVVYIFLCRKTFQCAMLSCNWETVRFFSGRGRVCNNAHKAMLLLFFFLALVTLALRHCTYNSQTSIKLICNGTVKIISMWFIVRDPTTLQMKARLETKTGNNYHTLNCATSVIILRPNRPILEVL